jgi:chitodextrinase
MAAGEDAAALYPVSGSGLTLDSQIPGSPPVLSDDYWGVLGKRGGVAVIHSEPRGSDWRLVATETGKAWCWAAANSPRLDLPEQETYEWEAWIYGYDENDWTAARDFGKRVRTPATMKAEFAQHLFAPGDLPHQDLADGPVHIQTYPLKRIGDDYIPFNREKGGIEVAWYNSAWAYRKGHVLNGSTVGLLTDYAVPFVVHYGGGADSGGDVFLNGNCRADFGDVRFTNSADSLLDYWIESKIDGVSALFWVEVDSIPASPGSCTVYIYYGNAAVVSAANGKATFDWFDDFVLDSSADYEIGRHTTLWHGLGAYNPYYDPVNRRVAYDTGDNFTGGWKVRSPNLQIQNFAAKVTFGVTGSYPINTTNGILGRWTGNSSYYGFYVAGGNYTAPALVRDGRTTVIASPAGNSYHPFGGTPHTAELKVYGSSLVGIYNEGQVDEVILTATDATHSGSGQVEVIIAQATGWFDVFFVRKYVVPEPAHGAWGGEEGVADHLEVTGSGSMAAGTSNELTITAYDQSGSVATGYSGLKNLIFSGPGVAPDGTAPTVEGTNVGGVTVVNFTNGVSDAGAATLIAYLAETTTVDVSDGTIDSTGDPGYDLDLQVDPGAPDNLIFGQQPTDSTAAAVIAPPVTVEVRDAWNNVRTADNTTGVTLSINSNPGGGTLSGTATRTAAAGIATFADLSIDRAGIGYTLDAASPGLSGDASVSFDISAGAAASVVIEDAADGTGTEVTTHTLSSGQSFTVYAITRDASGNFVANEAVTWSLISMTGGVVGGDLVPAGNNRSATFTGNLTGTTQINAVHASVGSDSTGVVTVTAGSASSIVIEDAADGTGTEVMTRALSSGQSFTVYSITRDGAGNFVANEAATWSLINMTGGVVGGDLVPAGDNRSAVFTGGIVGTARINAVHASVGSDSTGVVTVSAGAAASVVIEDAADGTGTEVMTRALSSGQSFTVYSITRDGAGNFVANEAVAWSLINMTGGVVGGDLVPAGDNRSAVFTGGVVGTARINAVHAGAGSDSTGIVTVSAGTASRVVIEDTADGSGAEVLNWTLASGQSFTVYSITRDGAGNFVANEAVAWSLINMTGGVVSGDLVPAGDNRSADFIANAGGSARISAVHAGLGSDTTGIITVRNRPPVAVAGSDVVVLMGETAYLDGSASYDPDGDPLTYRWSFLNKPPDSGAVLSDSRSAHCSFVADIWGEYMIRLIVNDGMLDSQPDDVRVQVRAYPVALFTFSPASGLIPLEVSFDASASYDPDGTIVSYQWDFGDGTTGQGVGPRHTYTAVGWYQIVLKVTDNDGLSDTETKSVLVKRLYPPLAVSLKREINRSLFKQEAFHTIRWSHNPDNAGLNITGYRIYRKDAQAGDGSYQLLNTVSGSTLSYVDGYLDIDKRYVYVVTAVEASGRESQMSSPVGN